MVASPSVERALQAHLAWGCWSDLPALGQQDMKWKRLPGRRWGRDRGLCQDPTGVSEGEAGVSQRVSALTSLERALVSAGLQQASKRLSDGP